MKAPYTYYILLLTLLSLSTYAQLDIGEDYAPQQILVQFERTSSLQEREALRKSFQAQELQYFESLDIALWQVPESLTIQGTPLKSIPDMVRHLHHHPIIATAEPNYRYQLLDTTPNDTHYDDLWGMEMINAPAAWDISTGSHNVTVALLDTGIDFTHPDLVDNIWQNLGEDADGDGEVLVYLNGQWQFDPGDIDGIDNDNNGYPDDFIGWNFYHNDNNPYDEHSHGTHCAGTIAGVGNNATGVAGVAWDAQIMALKIFSHNGWTYTSAIISAILYSIDNDAPISNNSWGGGGYSSILNYTLLNSEMAGQLFVAAAGNYNINNDNNPYYPASYTHNNIISVGASNFIDIKTGFSHYGASTVDVFAPGASNL